MYVRLATAHTALTSHLTHQTRIITTLTHPLVSPLAITPSPEIIAELAPLLTALLQSLPQPPATALPSIHAFNNSTTELLSTLSYLSDTLHMARQTTTQAARKLRSSREILSTIKREMQDAETSDHWIESGDWDRRIREREAQQACREVVDGFEKACDSWRARLVAMDGGGSVEVGAG